MLKNVNKKNDCFFSKTKKMKDIQNETLQQKNINN